MLLNLVLTPALALCVAPQSPVTYKDTVLFPTYGVESADHGTTAVNHFGDAIISNHSELAGGSPQLVESNLVAYIGNDLWLPQPGAHLLLGDPVQNLLGGVDSCSKPDVVALEDGSFVVAWARVDTTNRLNSRLEAARITVRDPLGNLLPAPIVDTLAAGEGHVIDTPASGEAGIMVDLVALGGNEVAAVYAHHLNQVTTSAGNTLREFDLRLMRMDWDLGPGDPNFLDGPHTLVATLPMDTAHFQTMRGGLVLPDVELDDLGHLLVVSEENLVEGHNGHTGLPISEIRLRRFEGFGHPAPLTLLDDLLVNPPTSVAQRRPMIAVSRHDATNDATIVWGAKTFNPNFKDRVLVAQAEFDSPTPSVGPAYWQDNPNAHDRRPNCIHTPNLHVALGVRYHPHGTQQLTVGVQDTQSMAGLATASLKPRRPAPAVYDPVVGNPGPARRVVFIGYEGSANGSKHRIRMMLRRLP